MVDSDPRPNPARASPQSVRVGGAVHLQIRSRLQAIRYKIVVFAAFAVLTQLSSFARLNSAASGGVRCGGDFGEKIGQGDAG